MATNTCGTTTKKNNGGTTPKKNNGGTTTKKTVNTNTCGTTTKNIEKINTGNNIYNNQTTNTYQSSIYDYNRNVKTETFNVNTATISSNTCGSNNGYNNSNKTPITTNNEKIIEPIKIGSVKDFTQIINDAETTPKTYKDLIDKSETKNTNLCSTITTNVNKNKKDASQFDAFSQFQNNKKENSNTKFNFGIFDENSKPQIPKIASINKNLCIPTTTKKNTDQKLKDNDKERNYFDIFNKENWKDFGKEILNNTKKTGATIGTGLISLGEGLMLGGEALLDAGGLIATGLCSIPTLIYDGITYKSRPEGMESATEYLWEQSRKKIEEERVKDSMNDVFYQDIKLGKTLKENSYAFDTVRDVGNTIGYAVEMIGVATAASGALAATGAASTGEATSAVLGTTGGLGGFGKGTEKAWNDGADNLATVVGFENGLYEGGQYLIGGEFANSQVFENKAVDVALKSIINGGLNSGKMPYDSLMETTYKNEDYSTIFEKNGGIKEVAKNFAIGTALSAIGETINLKKGINEYADDIGNKAKAPKLNEYANGEMIEQFQKEYGEFMDSDLIRNKIEGKNIFEKASEVQKAYGSPNGIYDYKEVNGFNNGNVSHIRTDVSLDYAKGIAYHENLHQISSVFDQNGKKIGTGVMKHEYQNGIYQGSENAGINESITELLNKNGPAPNSPSGYDPAVKKLDRLIDDGFLTNDDLKSAYLCSHDVDDLSKKILQKTSKYYEDVPSEKFLSPQVVEEHGLAGEKLYISSQTIVNKIWKEFDNAISSDLTKQKSGLNAIDNLIDLLEDYYC